MPEYDLLIKGGEAIMPATQFRGRIDLAISKGRIETAEPDISPDRASQVVDASGKLVVPGLIDLHTHLGFELHTITVDPNDYCPPSGVTTAVDMGSTGAYTFPWYRQRVLAHTVTRLREFINIASLGVIAIHNPYYVEKYGRYVDVQDTIQTIEENREHIRGIKVFGSSSMVGDWALEAVRAARQVAEAVDLPVAVHIGSEPPALEEVLSLLERGDIVTHCYTPGNQGILDERRRVRPAVRKARERGVMFDIGHGAGSFSFEVARAALSQDFPPDAISTDIWHGNVETPVKDLPTTIAKFVNLGVPLEEAIAMSTRNPALAIGESDLGTLQPGRIADVTMLSLREGQFSFVDCRKQTLEGKWLLDCEMTIYGGEIVYQKGAE